MTYRVRGADGDTDLLTSAITVSEPATAQGLVVQSVSASDTTSGAGSRFTLCATVRNGGDASATATSLRYRRSTNATIAASDKAVSSDAARALAASGTSAELVSRTAPSSAGTYY